MLPIQIKDSLEAVARRLELLELAARGADCPTIESALVDVAIDGRQIVDSVRIAYAPAVAA